MASYGTIKENYYDFNQTYKHNSRFNFLKITLTVPITSFLNGLLKIPTLKILKNIKRIPSLISLEYTSFKKREKEYCIL